MDYDLLLHRTRTRETTCYACGVVGAVFLRFHGPFEPDDDDWHLAYVQWQMEQGPAVCEGCIGQRIRPC